MTKRSVIRCVLSLVMLVYICVSIPIFNAQAASEPYDGLQINVIDPENRRFVTIDDIAEVLGPLTIDVEKNSRQSIDTRGIEALIRKMDNIESANCVMLNNEVLRLDVVPLQPVARVFELSGKNYYINRTGKKMQGGPRYRVDVPVITGAFSSAISPLSAIPVLDYIQTDPRLQALTSAIHIDKRGDIFLLPAVRGHIVNLGDASGLQNKFARLLKFYEEVLPVKGWETYDTLYVKWQGQIVGHIRDYKPTPPPVVIEEHDDIDDIGTMLTTVASEKNEQ